MTYSEYYHDIVYLIALDPDMYVHRATRPKRRICRRYSHALKCNKAIHRIRSPTGEE